MREPRKPASREAAFAFFLFSSLAAVAFAIAALTTLPLFEAALAAHLFRLMLKLSAGALILAELAELSADPVPVALAWALCLLSVAGSCIYIWSASVYSGFNSGEGYMIAEFFVSLAYELKILALILNERSFKRVVRQEKRRFLRYACIALGTILFLIATILLELNEGGWTAWAAGITNALAGVTFLVSILLLVKRDKHKGYEDFELSASAPVPRVV